MKNSALEKLSMLTDKPKEKINAGVFHLLPLHVWCQRIWEIEVFIDQTDAIRESRSLRKTAATGAIFLAIACNSETNNSIHTMPSPSPAFVAPRTNPFALARIVDVSVARLALGDLDNDSDLVAGMPYSSFTCFENMTN